MKDTRLTFRDLAQQMVRSGEARDFHHACQLLGKRGSRAAASRRRNRQHTPETLPKATITHWSE